MNKQTASQDIVNYLLRQIQSGALRKGDKLPTEHELTALLGVSRIPLREAICALRTVGLLESRQGGGTYVTTRCEPAILGRMLYTFALLENVSLHQVIDVRMLLEPESARQAALQATQRQREEIAELAAQYRELAQNYTASAEADAQIAKLDRELHKAIAVASHNDFLWMMLTVSGTSFDELNAKNSRALDEWGERNRLQFAEQHCAVAQAIVEGNAAQARKAMEKHLQQIKNALTARP